MLYTMADNNISILARQDGALYNYLSGQTDCVFKGIGNQFAISSSVSSFSIVLGSGEGVVGGRHVTERSDQGENTSITLSANSSGYVVIRVDLSKPAGAEAQLMGVPTIVRQNLNNNGTIRDLPLYKYTTNAQGVSSFTDVREILDGTELETRVNKLETTDIPNLTNRITSLDTRLSNEDTTINNRINDILKVNFNSAVSATYDIEQRGNYTQYQSSNSSANSLVTASGQHLYTLLSYASPTATVASQIAIMLDGSMWFRTWKWWGSEAGWLGWSKVEKHVPYVETFETRTFTENVTFVGTGIKTITNTESIKLGQYETFMGIKSMYSTNSNIRIVGVHGNAMEYSAANGQAAIEVQCSNPASNTGAITLQVVVRRYMPEALVG